MEFITPSLESLDLLRQHLQYNNYQACELSLANNIMWSQFYGTGFIIVENMLVFGVKKGDKLERVSFPFGMGDEKKAFDTLVEYFDNEGIPFKMYLVSEESYEKISAWYPGVFSVKYDRDNADYLYVRESLDKLSGKKLHGKRNHINKFLEMHPDYEYERINSTNKDECMLLEEAWLAEVSGDGEESRSFEREAIGFALNHMDELGLKGALIRVDGEVCAFTIGEPLTRDTFVIHFEKAKASIQGSYPLINREFVRRELSDYTYVNREEDMGIPGLRYAKSTYQPTRLIYKGFVSREKGK